MHNFDAVLTCYNAENTIALAIESILNQTIPLSKIFIIDDNSTDNSFQILEHYKKFNKQIQLIRNDLNVGQSVSRNLGVSQSQSDFIIFFDDDDISSPNRVEAHKLMFENGADISFVSSRIVYSGTYSKLCINSKHLGKCEIEEMAQLLLLGRPLESGLVLQIPACTSAVSRKAFDFIGGYDPDLRRLEDVDLALKFSLHGKTFGFSSDMLVSRFATFSSDKGSGLDMLFEVTILERFAIYLTNIQFERALIHAKSRKLYFSRRFFALSIHLIKNPRYLLKICAGSLVPFRRVLHDLRKALSR
jgi:glycosyltransferase involved in cell wall biosynthesis